MLSQFRSLVVSSANVGGRVYPETLPQDPTLPAITYQVISEVRRPTMHGTDHFPQVRVQVDTWAKTALEARSVADAVREGIDGFQGVMGSPGVEVGGMFAGSSFTSYEPDAKMYRVSRDYLVWAREMA